MLSALAVFKHHILHSMYCLQLCCFSFVFAFRTALPCSALLCHAMATSTALKAFMQAPRDQRVTALRSLGAEKMVQLEGELREARLTLFGPLPASKSGKAPPASPPAGTVPPPKQCPAQIPPPPKEEPIPAPPKDPPTPRGPPPRDGTPHRERQAARGSADPAPHRQEARGSADPAPHGQEARGSDDPAPQRQKPGHWTKRDASGRTSLMPMSGTTSRPPMQRPAPPHQPSTLHRTQHHTLHRTRHSTQHSNRATLMWVGPLSTPRKKASPRARPSKHSTGPHPPPFPGPPPRDGPTHPQLPPGTPPRIALQRSARAATCTPKRVGSRLGMARAAPCSSLTQGRYVAPSNAAIPLAASIGCPAINPCTAPHRTMSTFCTAAPNARSSKTSIAQLRPARIASP